MVEFGKAEGSFAELTMLLLRVRKPFHQTFLVNIHDAATAFAWVIERLLFRRFATTYPAENGFVLSAFMSPDPLQRGHWVFRIGHIEAIGAGPHRLCLRCRFTASGVQLGSQENLSHGNEGLK